MSGHGHKKSASFKVESKGLGAVCKEYPSGGAECNEVSVQAYLDSMLADGWEFVSSVDTMWIFKATK